MSSRAPLLSIVVATHNRPDRLGDLLDSFAGQSAPAGTFEVVVVDDGSKDGRTEDILASHPARDRLGLRVIRRPMAQGPAAARNDGWRAAHAPLVAFTDDDCVATPDWVEECRRAAITHPGAIVQGRTEPRPDELHHRGPFTRTLCIDRLGPFFQTCNILYPRQVLERLDGFDAEAYSAPGGEDTDLAWRAMEMGTPTVFAAEAVVQHAVERHGPLGFLRIAWRWTDSMQAYSRHPDLRDAVFTKRFFWKPDHYLFVRALLALLLPRRLRGLRRWLAWPYAVALVWRCLQPDARGPVLLPYLALHDAVEVGAVARAAVRYRIPVL